MSTARRSRMSRPAWALKAGGLLCLMLTSSLAMAQGSPPDNSNTSPGVSHAAAPCAMDYGHGICGERPSVVAKSVHGQAYASKIDMNFDSYDLYAVPTKPDSPHRLFFFIPGTKMSPSQYREIMEKAVENGLYAVSVSYPNGKSNGGACALNPSINCTEENREDTIYGDNPNDKSAPSTINSIKQRLIDFLTYLNENGET